MNKKSFIFFFVLIWLIPCSSFAQNRNVVGWIEKVRISPGDLVLHAKLDTGAEKSSIHAESVDEFEVKGKKWVRFEISDPYGKTLILERPIVNIAKIKRLKSKSSSRLVVPLGICLGDSYMEAEVSLENRSHFSYKMLVGRSFLAGHAVVDPAVMFTTEPKCKQ